MLNPINHAVETYNSIIAEVCFVNKHAPVNETGVVRN